MWLMFPLAVLSLTAEAHNLDSGNLLCNYLYLYSLVSGSAVTGNLHGVKWANLVT